MIKKTIFLVSLFAALLIAGCNQKDLVHQIDGTWHVQEYAVNGVNKTSWFDSTYSGFTWNFSGTINYTQSYNLVRTYTIWSYDTITSLDTTTHTLVIDSITLSRAVVPVTQSVNIKGQWYLTNGNEFLETQDSVNGNLQYQIISHSKNSLHLLNGNVDYYLSQ